MEYKKGMKTVEESRTEITKLLHYEHINGENRLFGGRLMAWIDEAAAVAAMRHAGGLRSANSAARKVSEAGRFKG